MLHFTPKDVQTSIETHRNYHFKSYSTARLRLMHCGHRQPASPKQVPHIAYNATLDTADYTI